MFKELWSKILARPEGHEGTDSTRGREARFTLRSGTVTIGHLWFDGEAWGFAYSDEFHEQNKISPLFGFPEPGTVYRTKHLWPFFAVRIPSLLRPSVRQAIDDEEFDPTDQVVLLQRFGRKTVANPFILEPAPTSNPPQS